MNKKKKLEVKNIKTSKISFSLTEVIIMIFIAMLFGGVTGSLIVIGRNSNDKYLDEFYETYNNVVNNYYKKVNKSKLMDSAIEGMINYLGDPYSIYMNTDEAESFNQTVNGEYKGIGVTVGMIDNKPTVIAMFDSSPAKKAGMKIGDVITKVNNESVENKDLNKIIEMIKKKNKVTIVVLRDSKEETLEMSIESVELPSVTSKVIEKNNKKIGVISVSVFAANTYSQFLDNMNKLENKKIDSLVIDVRDNPGGHLTQVTKIISLFLDKKKVIYQIEYKGKKTKVYSTTNDKKTYPVAVLINKSSASASEILAGAMKESYNATIVGVTSYGKGTVQEEYSLNSGASIKYTTEKWLTPKGNSINKKGIEPNVVVELSDEYKNDPKEENDNQLQTALDYVTK